GNIKRVVHTCHLILDGVQAHTEAFAPAREVPPRILLGQAFPLAMRSLHLEHLSVLHSRSTQSEPHPVAQFAKCAEHPVERRRVIHPNPPPRLIPGHLPATGNDPSKAYLLTQSLEHFHERLTSGPVPTASSRRTSSSRSARSSLWRARVSK